MISLHCISRIRKRTIIFILIISYLINFLFFGLFYWKLANVSHGSYFIYQLELEINTKSQLFMKNLNLNYHNNALSNSIKKLFSLNEYNRNIITFTDSQKNNVVFSIDGDIGDNWAEFYTSLYSMQGYTHFSVINENQDLLNGKYITQKLSLSFYKVEESKEKFNLIDKTKDNYIKKTVSIWVNNYSEVKNILRIKENVLYPTELYLKPLTTHCVTFLDNSPIILKNIQNEEPNYPLNDYLYFSAVTLTSLGYGDILPYSSLARGLVMLETISGVIIIGLLVSSLFWNKK
jgi:voltage-gated potassium channel